MEGEPSLGGGPARSTASSHVGEEEMSDLFALFDSPDEGPSTASAAGPSSVPTVPAYNPSGSVGIGGGAGLTKRPTFVASSFFGSSTTYEPLTASLASLSQSEILEGDNAYGCEACTAAVQRAAAAERRQRRAYAAAAKPPLLPRPPSRSGLGSVASSGSGSAPPPAPPAAANGAGVGVVELARSGLAAADGGGVDSAAVSMCSGSSVSDGEEDGGAAPVGSTAPITRGASSAAGPSQGAVRPPAVSATRVPPRRDPSSVSLAIPSVLSASASAVAPVGSMVAGLSDVEVDGTDTSSWDGETEGECGSAHSASAQASSADGGDSSLWRDVPRPSSPANLGSDAEDGISVLQRRDVGPRGSLSQGDLSPPSPASSASFAGTDGAMGRGAATVGSAVTAPVLAAMLEQVPASRVSSGAKEPSEATAGGVTRTTSALTLRDSEGKDEPGAARAEPNADAADPITDEGDVEEDFKVPTVRTRAERRERLQMVPEVLILQLQRFTQTPRGGLRKLSGHVPFPLDLDMSPYMAPPAKGAGGPADGTAASDGLPSPPSVQAAARAAKKHKKSRPQSAVPGASASVDGSAPSEDGVASVASLRSDGCPSWSDDSGSVVDTAATASDEEAGLADGTADESTESLPLPSVPSRVTRPDGRYALSGVVVHGGSLYTGHYTCYVRGAEVADAPLRAPGASPAHEWWYCSDTHVSSASEKDVLGAEAYLLFYTAVRGE